jgi:hypothetical protein
MREEVSEQGEKESVNGQALTIEAATMPISAINFNEREIIHGLFLSFRLYRRDQRFTSNSLMLCGRLARRVLSGRRPYGNLAGDPVALGVICSCHGASRLTSERADWLSR